MTARLVEGQLAEDGTYPNAEVIFSEVGADTHAVTDFSPDQPRDPNGRWTSGGEIPNIHQKPNLLNDPVVAKLDSQSIQLAGTTKNFKYACKKSKLDENEASDTLHAAKHAHGLGGADNCTFDTDTGDIIHNGEIIGNLGG